MMMMMIYISIVMNDIVTLVSVSFFANALIIYKYIHKGKKKVHFLSIIISLFQVPINSYKFNL